MASRTKELLLSCGESIIQRSKSADGLQSLEDVIQLQNTLERALGAVLLLRNEFLPINQLPMETLGHVFDLVCTQGQDPNPTRSRHATSLAQVCDRWRSNVISNPLMWSTIHISQKARPEFVTLCLERSKDVPLDIVLEIRGPIPTFTSLPTYPSTMVQPVELLIANSGRARRLSFKFEHEFSSRSSVRIGEDPVEQVASEEIFRRFFSPGLVSLEWDAGINMTAITRGSIVRLPDQFVEGCLRNLQSLSLRNTFTGPAHGVENLREFHLTYTGGLRADVTPRQLHEFLLRNMTLECISLERCTLVPDRERGIPVDPVILNQLTTLKLDQIDVPMFFEVASAPSIGAITSVRLDPLVSAMKVNSSDGSVEIHTSPSAWDTIRTFMEVRIDTFHIQGDAPPVFGFGQQPWRALLHRVPTFRVLQIAGNVQGYKEALVLSLSREPDHFTNLETLQLDANLNATTTAFIAIAEIAESRARRGRHLTKVECLHDIGGSATERWKALYDQHRIQDHLLCEGES